MPVIVLAYLGSHFLSLLGNSVLAVALPLIVLQTTGSPLDVGIISTATAVPAVLVGLFAGVVLDRMNRRTCSVLADLISAASVAAIPLADLLFGLNLWWLIGLAVVGAFGDVPGMTAREVLVPAVARHTGVPLERLVGLRQSLTSMALVVGPAAAGTLLVLLEGTTVLLVTAATSALAAVLTLVLPHRFGQVEAAGAPRGSVWQQLTAGARVLRGSRFLTGLVGLTVGLAVVLGGVQGLVLPLYFTRAGQEDLLGFVLTALAVGMLAGTAGFAVVGARLPRRIWLTLALIGTTTGFLLIATLLSPAVVFVGAVLVGVANALLGATVGVLQAERVPDEVRGRVLSLQNAVLLVAAPAGIALAGVVAEYGSPVTAGLAVNAVWLVVLAAVLLSRALVDLEPKERTVAQQ
ncbi:MFS transporter [Desertihabitans aurantiacus]|uniref:MFS transporter n=1 Tax=Desertihabitans aurantiacus TaxID=2282477 RepID=UPI000DF80AC9|nr:MFS transporter [Desertihabitans aurantiacus]